MEQKADTCNSFQVITRTHTHTHTHTHIMHMHVFMIAGRQSSNIWKIRKTLDSHTQLKPILRRR